MNRIVTPEEADHNRMMDHQQQIDDIKMLLNTAAGVRFFKRFFSEGKIFHSTFDVNHAISARAEGQRLFTLRFLTQVMEAAPERLSELLIRPVAPPSEGSDMEDE